MIKLKALLVVRRIVSWQILCMDKCVCVVHLFYTRAHEWFNATSLFAFVHVCHTGVPFKLWVICTVEWLGSLSKYIAICEEGNSGDVWHLCGFAICHV